MIYLLQMVQGRITVVFALLALLGIQWPIRSVAADALLEARKVVFVCEHGSVKSLVAASYFNRSAQSRGLPYRAVARGTAPDRSVPAAVQAGLRAIGLDVSSYVPQLFQVSDLQDASLVVSFDQDIAATIRGRVRHLQWDNLPAVLADYARGRDAIVEQVDSLVEALAQGHALAGGVLRSDPHESSRRVCDSPTDIPCAANRSTMAAPRPDPAPVTTAVPFQRF